jgi:hypothetical protein
VRGLWRQKALEHKTWTTCEEKRQLEPVGTRRRHRSSTTEEKPRPDLTGEQGRGDSTGEILSGGMKAEKWLAADTTRNSGRRRLNPVEQAPTANVRLDAVTGARASEDGAMEKSERKSSTEERNPRMSLVGRNRRWRLLRAGRAEEAEIGTSQARAHRF